MNLQWVFIAQIATIVSFVIGLFVLYRVLVQQKDATIELLREKLSGVEKQLEESRASSPDSLAKSLSDRIRILSQELERLRDDGSSTQAQIALKEEELGSTTAKLATLREELAEIQEITEEFFCPNCRSRMVSREYHEQWGEYEGRDISYDTEVTQFECGLVLVDGKESPPCPNPRIEIGSSPSGDAT